MIRSEAVVYNHKVQAYIINDCDLKLMLVSQVCNEANILTYYGSPFVIHIYDLTVVRDTCIRFISCHF